jgi:hypothetical protein
MRIEGTTIDDAWRNSSGLHLYSQYWDIVKEMVY